jgi:ubiquitin-conjugating enzyme E2 Z
MHKASTARIIYDIGTASELQAGIHYFANESNMFEGTALIFGPVDTPYHGLPLFFQVTLRPDYPFSPPVLKYQPGERTLRIHPNIYTEGKVCLSILGTWEGPSWTPVMSLRTVFLSIMGLLDSNPLVHEPGKELCSKEVAQSYSECVRYNSLIYIYNILCRLKDGGLYPYEQVFEDVLKEKKETILSNAYAIVNSYAQRPPIVWISDIHNKAGTSDYSSLAKKYKLFMQTESLP